MLSSKKSQQQPLKIFFCPRGKPVQKRIVEIRKKGKKVFEEFLAKSNLLIFILFSFLFLKVILFLYAPALLPTKRKKMGETRRELFWSPPHSSANLRIYILARRGGAGLQNAIPCSFYLLFAFGMKEGKVTQARASAIDNSGDGSDPIDYHESFIPFLRLVL